MKKAVRISVFLLSALLTVAGWRMPVFASVVSDAGLSVNAVIPDNQIDTGKTYFDLQMQPGQKQDLTVAVVNPNSWDIDVVIELITASTNLNGIINYTAESELRDESLRYAFVDIAELSDSQIVVPAYETKDVTVTVTMPEKSYDGLILGAIRVVKLPTEDEKNTGAMIINQYSYVTGVRLRETDIIVEQDFVLGAVGPELVNYRAAVIAQIRNVVPEIAENVTVEGKLFQKDSDVPLIERVQPGVEMAPNSSYPFAFVDEAGYGFEPGDYLSTLTIKYEEKTWNFEREFTIEAEQAQSVNNNALNQQQNAPTAVRSSRMHLWVWVLIGVVGLLIITILIVLLHIRRNNREYEVYMRQIREKKQ